MVEGVFTKKWDTYLRKNVNGVSIFDKQNMKKVLFVQDENGGWEHLTNPDIKYKMLTGNSTLIKEEKQYCELSKKNFNTLKPQIILWHEAWKQSAHSDINVWYLDIEAIDPNKSEFPDTFSGQIPVTHIQILDNKINAGIIFMWKDISEKKKQELKEKYKNDLKDLKFIVANSEEEMFEKFIKLLKKRNPTIITGWNAESFDFPYLTIRAEVLGIDKNEFSPLGETKYKDFEEFGKKRRKVTWKGIYLIDLMLAFKKFTFKDQKSYSLDHIAKVFLGEDKGKVDYGEDKSIRMFFVNNYEKFTDYAVMDIVLLRDIDKTVGLLKLIQTVAEMMGTNYDNVFGTVAPWTDLLTHLAIEKKKVLPSEPESSDHRPIVGGYVKDPIFGLIEWLFSYDYNSLYPSIQVAFNLSPDTYIPYHKLPQEAKEIIDYANDENEEKLLNNLDYLDKIEKVCKKYNIEFAGLGFFRIDEQGILPEILEEFYYGRKTEKQKMLKAEAILNNKNGKKLSAVEISNLIEEDLSWDDVYAYSVEERFMKTLEEYAVLKNVIQQAMKVNINSEFGFLDNNHSVVSNRNISGSITFMGRFLNRMTGRNIEKYLKENYNIQNSWIYADTDSGYLSLAPIIKKWLKEDFNTDDFTSLSDEDKRAFIDKILDFINGEIQPIIDNTIEFIRKKFNSYKKGFMGAKVEKIALKGFWTAKKRYALLTLYDEGSYFVEKPKIKTTGLEVAKSQTPDYAIEILNKALYIILNGNQKELQEFIENSKVGFFEKKPSLICEVVKINKLNYSKDGRGYYRINENGLRIGAPMNSKGGICYNQLRKEMNLEEYHQEIEEGMKSFIAKLKTPNPTEFDVVAFLNDSFLEDTGLMNYIDYDYSWNKNIITPLETITKAIGWELEKTNKIDINEW